MNPHDQRVSMLRSGFPKKSKAIIELFLAGIESKPKFNETIRLAEDFVGGSKPHGRNPIGDGGSTIIKRRGKDGKLLRKGKTLVLEYEGEGAKRTLTNIRTDTYDNWVSQNGPSIEV